MKVKSEFDLICAPVCLDIHKESREEIIKEMKVFIKMLSSTETGGQDSYKYGYLYSRSFDVLEQILYEYFSFMR